MTELKGVIAKNITELRKRDGLTQADLAEKLNYTDKAISKWERAESVPDITVLKSLADLFHVPVDYLITEVHEISPAELAESRHKTKKKNRGFITGMSILLLWLLSTLAYVILEYVDTSFPHNLIFVYSVPASAVVWLVFNSIWFDPRTNFVIISVLMWTVLASVVISFTVWNISGLKIFVIGIFGQAIIVMWSRITRKEKIHK